MDNPSTGQSTPDKTSRCVFILGMHRSGTSVLAGSLQEAGLYLGKVLSNNVSGKNPKGLIEPEALIFMHENLLQANGGNWHTPPQEIIWQRLHTSVRDLFIESRANRPHWGFKEPRTLITFEGWVNAVDTWDAVGIIRDPAKVAMSLHNRNGFDLNKCFDIWMHYNQRLLALHKKYGFPIIEFASDAEQTLAGIQNAIKILGLDSSAPLSFYEPSLRKFEDTKITIPPQVQQLFDALLSCRA